MNSDESAKTRSYRSELRAEQAAQTRRKVLDAAATRFSAGGYAGTSLADIAKEAGVSVETVKLTGPKRELLVGAFEQTFAVTEGEGPLIERGEPQIIFASEDNDEFLEGLVRFIAEANRRANRLWTCYHSAAASDPLIAKSLAELFERRRTEFNLVIAGLAARGMLEGDADHAELADAASFLISPESYTQLVEQSGWSMERYIDWLLVAARRMILQSATSQG